MKVSLDWARPLVTYSCRDFLRMNVFAFTFYLRQTISFTASSSDVDEAVHELEQDINRGIDRLAHVRVRTIRLGTLGNKWFRTEANEAKRETLTRKTLLEKNDRQRIGGHIAPPVIKPVH